MKDPDRKEINHIRDQKQEVSNAFLPMKRTSLDAIGEYAKPPNTTRDSPGISACLMKKILS